MMKNTELLKIINEILLGTGMEKLTSITDKDNLRDDLGFDSFMLAELTVMIEDKTNIDIFENDYISTIEQIKEKLNG